MPAKSSKTSPSSSFSLVSVSLSTSSSWLLLFEDCVTPYDAERFSGPSDSLCVGARTGRGSGIALSGIDRRSFSLLLLGTSTPFSRVSRADRSGGEGSGGAALGFWKMMALPPAGARLEDLGGGGGSSNVGLGSKLDGDGI